MSLLPSIVSKANRSDELWKDEAKLIAQCVRGDEVAWNVFLSKYKNLVFSIPIKFGFSREESADVFQSVCLDLLNDLGSVREPRAITAWLIRVTYNKCILQSQMKRRHPMESGDLENIVAAEDVSERKLHEARREEALRTALHSLGARCNKLVTMLFLEVPARPYDEIAQMLSLAEGSIGPIRRRCLNSLRKVLESEGFDE